MNEYKTTRHALEAYLFGKATLDEVSEAANRSIAGYFARTGHVPAEALAPRETQETKQPD